MLPWVLCSSLLFTVSFPPLALRSVAWIALVPWMLALRRLSVRSAIGLSVVWGLASGYGITDWLIPAVAVYYQQPAWVGVAVLTVSTVGGAVIDFLLFALLYRWAALRQLPLLPLFTAAAWAVCDLGRARLAGGNPWGLLGYSQAGVSSSPPPGALEHVSLAVVQVADLGGVLAVGFVVAAVNAGVAELVHWKLARPFGRSPIGTLAAAAVIFVLALAYGQARLGHDLDWRGDPVEVAVIQGNLDLGSRWRPELYGNNLETYLRMTAEAAAVGNTRMVFWPENAMTFFVDDEPAYRRAIARVTLPYDVELVAGAPRYEGVESPSYFNSAFVIAPDGTIAGRYDKEVLLPFAEYFPLPELDLLRRSFGRVREFTPGTRALPLNTRAGKASVAICNEAMFGRIVRARVSEQPSYLVNLSNDGWVGDVEFAEHQLNMVSLRATEHKRYLVRASTSGPSAIVDPWGRILTRTRPFTRAILRGEIHAVAGTTLYQRIGDAFAWACLAAVAGVVLLSWLASGQDRKTGARFQ